MNQVNRITITAGGAPGSGKTSLLMLLLDMMGDMGLLAHHETKSHTLDPRSHFAEARVMNADSEAIEVMIDMEAVLAARLALDTFNAGDAEAVLAAEEEEPRVQADVQLDAMLMTLMTISPRHAIEVEVTRILDTIEANGLPWMPLTINFDAV